MIRLFILISITLMICSSCSPYVTGELSDARNRFNLEAYGPDFQMYAHDNPRHGLPIGIIVSPRKFIYLNVQSPTLAQYAGGKARIERASLQAGRMITPDRIWMMVDTGWQIITPNP